jgi:hypothetical protein
VHIYSIELPVKDLLFGVNRDKNWWKEFPRRMKMLNKITESISNEGLKNPLTVHETPKGYVVEVGNQRLQALNDLRIEKANCILYSKREYPEFKKASAEECILPNDTDLWDADIQFKEE